MIKKMIKKWIKEVMSETPVDYDELSTRVDVSNCEIEYERLADHVCMYDLSSNLDYGDLAGNISASDVACEIDKGAVAEHVEIDYEDVQEEIAYDTLAEHVDLDSLSQQIDYEQIVIDYDKVMTKGDDSVKAILNALSNFELAITEMRMTLQTEE
jgi:hypothetical protein